MIQVLNFTTRLSVRKVEAALSGAIAGYRLYLSTNRRSDVGQDFGRTPKTGIQQTQTGILVLD